jgi:hypothetical protein
MGEALAGAMPRWPNGVADDIPEDQLLYLGGLITSSAAPRDRRGTVNRCSSRAARPLSREDRLLYLGGLITSTTCTA